MTLYAVSFNNSDPRTYPSLAPTFLAFKNMVSGADITPPGITQLIPASGIYQFLYAPTVPTYFLLDGVTVNSTTDRYVYGVLDPSQQLDIQLSAYTTLSVGFQSSLVALGSTNFALGTTNVALGTTNVALGTTAVAIGISITAQAVSLTAQNVTLTDLISTSASLAAGLDAKIGSTLSSFGSNAVDPGDLFGYMKRTQEFLEGQQVFNKVTGSWQIQTRGASLLTTKTIGQSSSEVTRS